jgi:Mg/Co/Ni transporter MgtE
VVAVTDTAWCRQGLGPHTAADILGAMPVKEAVKILLTLSPELALGILKQMGPEVTARMLSGMKVRSRWRCISPGEISTVLRI